MKISKLLTDETILIEIGQRIARRRIALEITQADMAEQAGVGKRTLERIESGASAQMSSLIRVFRVLDLLPALDRVMPEAQPGPMDILKRKGKLRQRVSKRGQSHQVPEEGAQPWTWDDEK